MNSKSDNVGIMTGFDTDKIIGERFNNNIILITF